MIMCRAKVVGMARPNSRDRFPTWNSRWWVCSHPWHEVAFESADVAAGMEEGKEDSVVSRRVGPSGVEDILWLGTLDTIRGAAGGALDSSEREKRPDRLEPLMLSASHIPHS